MQLNQTMNTPPSVYNPEKKKLKKIKGAMRRGNRKEQVNKQDTDTMIVRHKLTCYSVVVAFLVCDLSNAVHEAFPNTKISD